MIAAANGGIFIGFPPMQYRLCRSKLDACEASEFHVRESSALHRVRGSTEMIHMPLGLGSIDAGSMSQDMLLSSRSREAKFNTSVSVRIGDNESPRSAVVQLVHGQSSFISNSKDRRKIECPSVTAAMQCPSACATVHQDRGLHDQGTMSRAARDASKYRAVAWL